MVKSRRRNSKRRSGRNGSVPRYAGPIRLPTYDGLDAAPIRVNLSYSFVVQSDVFGIARTWIAPNGLASCSDWANYVDSYQEYRVLGIEFHYEPYFNGSYDATVVQGAGASAVLHLPLTAAPATLDAVVSTTTWKPFRTSVSSKHHWKMRGFEEAPYARTSSTSDGNHGGIVYYVDNLTAETAYGRGIVTYLVEFRGRA